MVWKPVKYCMETCQICCGNLSTMVLEWKPVLYAMKTFQLWFVNLSNMVWKADNYGVETCQYSVETCQVGCGNLSNMIWKPQACKNDMETCQI